MQILSNIEFLLKQQGKMQKELCNYLGIVPAMFSMWKSGESESYMKYIPKIAKYFGVPIAQIYGEAGTPRHYALNKKIESLAPEQLTAVEAFIEILLRKENLK